MIIPFSYTKALEDEHGKIQIDLNISFVSTFGPKLLNFIFIFISNLTFNVDYDQLNNCFFNHFLHPPRNLRKTKSTFQNSISWKSIFLTQILLFLTLFSCNFRKSQQFSHPQYSGCNRDIIHVLGHHKCWWPEATSLWVSQKDYPRLRQP